MAKPIFLSRTSKRRLPPNWRKRLTVVESTDCDLVKFSLHFKGKLPKGFKRNQGVLKVSKRKPHVVCFAEVGFAFRFRGMGRLLYLHALKHFGQLSTDFPDASDNAQHLWERLSGEYCYKKTHHRLTVFNRKTRKPRKGLTYKKQETSHG